MKKNFQGNITLKRHVTYITLHLALVIIEGSDFVAAT